MLSRTEDFPELCPRDRTKITQNRTEQNPKNQRTRNQEKASREKENACGKRHGQRRREPTCPPTTATEGSASQRVGSALPSPPPWSPRTVQARWILLTRPIRLSMVVISAGPRTTLIPRQQRSGFELRKTQKRRTIKAQRTRRRWSRSRSSCSSGSEEDLGRGGHSGRRGRRSPWLRWRWPRLDEVICGLPVRGRTRVDPTFPPLPRAIRIRSIPTRADSVVPPPTRVNRWGSEYSFI